MSGALIGGKVRTGGAPWNGSGFVAGAPPGLVTVSGAPARRQVLVFERASRICVGQAWSATNGTYRIDNLSPTSIFDVFARDYTNTWEDVIVSRVVPVRYTLTSAGAFGTNDSTNTLTGTIAITGGVPPLTVSVSTGAAPPGITFGLTAASAQQSARVLGAAGATTVGTYSWTLRVTDADGRYVDIPCSATFT